MSHVDAATTFTGCVVMVRPVAILNLRDEKEGDAKILAVRRKIPLRSSHTMDQIYPHVRREIEHFFQI